MNCTIETICVINNSMTVILLGYKLMWLRRYHLDNYYLTSTINLILSLYISYYTNTKIVNTEKRNPTYSRSNLRIISFISTSNFYFHYTNCFFNDRLFYALPILTYKDKLFEDEEAG